VPKSIVRGVTSQANSKQVPVTVTAPQLIGPHALLVLKLSVPLCDPGVVQANLTVTGTLPPGVRVVGSAGLSTLNAGLFEVMALRVNSTLPGFLRLKT